MSWFDIVDPNKPPTRTRSEIMDQLAMAKLQTQLGQLQHNNLLPPPNYGASGGYAWSGSGGITAVSTAAGPLNINPYAYTDAKQKYIVSLPTDACEGDRVIIKYVDGGWTEERSIYAEINPKRNNNSGVFSLDEIDEARELINELSR